MKQRNGGMIWDRLSTAAIWIDLTGFLIVFFVLFIPNFLLSHQLLVAQFAWILAHWLQHPPFKKWFFFKFITNIKYFNYQLPNDFVHFFSAWMTWLNVDVVCFRRPICVQLVAMPSVFSRQNKLQFLNTHKLQFHLFTLHIDHDWCAQQPTFRRWWYK